MTDQWNDSVAALESSDTDRVNDAIEDIKSMGLEERLEFFRECFDDLAGVYDDSDDGYVRQSVLRVSKLLVPGLPATVALSDSTRNLERARIHEQTDVLGGFFLEGLTDEDGRVRRTAIRGLKDVCRTYDSLGDPTTIEAILAELDELADEYDESRRKHLLEAAEEVEFFLQSDFERLVSGFEREFGESKSE